MKKKVMVLLMGLMSSFVFADAELLNRSDVQNYINEQVKSGSMNRPELEAFFANAVNKPNIISVMDRPSTSRPWYQFKTNAVSTKSMNDGVAFWKKNRAALEMASKKYGVPAHVIVAIIGIETNYGRNTGSFRLADSLSTLAFNYPRRAEFFRKELTELLLLAKEERKDPLTFKGSYAGAMGMPQFMPSSFRKWAVDLDGDGQRDIWNNPYDVVGSVANYFKQHDWQTGGPILVPAAVSLNAQTEAALAENTQLKYTIKQLKQMGVTPLENVSDNQKAFVFSLETAPGVYDYYLGLNNFYTIWQYNHSRLYVKAVQELSDGIKSKMN
ncbi:lytic murein transglycosylase B [Neisseria sp. Ec49-e6-T10]|uniref:lytic murein transglycosylase B n=1 Tax=Neisseria sp. Ec49-e6-T10 TaxID=3140744 RepID=UPI003EBD8F51